jgi:transcriptional antiterminator RfaH
MTCGPQLSGLQLFPGAQWYAVQIRYRCERKVNAQLEHKGMETFLPLLDEIHRWSDRRQIVGMPLFSGYSFIRLEMSPLLRREVLRTAGVIGLITVAGVAAPIPGKQIEDVRQLLAQKIPCALHAFLKIGQQVRIRGGCLDKLEGILEERTEKNLVISIGSIQRSVAIRIEGYELELI